MRLRPLLLVLMMAALGGCAGVSDLVNSMSARPTADLAAVRLTDLTVDGVTLAMDVDVTNPTDIPLPISSLEYAVSTSETPFAVGQAPLGGPVAARGSKRVTAPVHIPFAELLRLVDGIRPGAVVPYDVAASMMLDAGPLGSIQVPFRRRGTLPIPAPPRVDLTSIRWTELSLTGARAELDLAIDNPNDFVLDLDQFAYGLALGGRSVARAGIEPGTRVPASGAGRLTIPIDLNPRDLGAAFLAALGGDRLDYALDGVARVGTPFGPVDLPYLSQGTAPATRR